jgi:hypothetical protein
MKTLDEWLLSLGPDEQLYFDSKGWHIVNSRGARINIFIRKVSS